MTTRIRLGTRGSPLALWQAQYVTALLRHTAPTCAVELVEIQTSGDLIRDVPLAQLGGQGAFTKEIQRALVDDRIDLAVHSLKDLPTFAVENLVLAAVPARGPVGDALVSHKHASFEALPRGAVVATSSLRRRAQVLHRRPDLRLVDMRGNVETRLRKLRELDLDALLLAQAGLERLKLGAAITEILNPAWLLPAVGQGALGLECRGDDGATLAVVERLNDPAARACVLAERAMLRGLGGGCQVPVGAVTALADGQLTLRGVVIRPDGSTRIEATLAGAAANPEALGMQLAELLLQQGARVLLTE